uniref:Uncharacterized protein n=1 Tax=uncultured prokaryote TaxID=198431 RepID=A0A0H5Q9M7_9ZZZZ|nr:hypothetical protein [uncultured prokaryote]
MCGVEPIVRTDEDQLPSLRQLLDRFQYKEIEVITETIEMALPQCRTRQLLFKFRLKVLPTNIGWVSDDDIETFLHRR